METVLVVGSKIKARRVLPDGHFFLNDLAAHYSIIETPFV